MQEQYAQHSVCATTDIRDATKQDKHNLWKLSVRLAMAQIVNSSLESPWELACRDSDKKK